MKINPNVLTFAQGNPKLLDQFQDYWNHYRSNLATTDRLAKKCEYDTTISFAEKEDKMNAAILKETIKRSGVNYATEGNISEWFNHPLVRYEVFAIVSNLIEMILPESIIDTIGLFTSVDQGAFGDSFAYEIKPSDLFAVSKSGKNQKQAEIKKQYSGLVTVIPEFREISVGTNLYKALSGKESLAEFTAKATRSLETRMTLDAFNLFNTTMQALPSTTTVGLQVSGFSAASLIRLCEQVQAWSFGAKPIIVGTKLALLNVLPDDANYRYTLSDPYVTMGYIPTAFGYDVLAFPQVADLTTQFGLAITNSYLWIIAPSSQKILKLCLEGSVMSFTDGTFDNANLTQTTTLKKSYGLAVVTNAVAGTIYLP